MTELELVAGAYAAAANLVKESLNPSQDADQIVRNILALTPADARQASQPQAVTAQGVYKARKASAINLIKGVDGPVPAGVTFVYLDAEGRRCMQFVCDCLPAHGRNADEDATRIADALNGAAAAIASAEARARLEEAKWWMEFTGLEVAPPEEREEGGEAIAAHMAELEAAARTPDSTKEQGCNPAGSS